MISQQVGILGGNVTVESNAPLAAYAPSLPPAQVEPPSESSIEQHRKQAQLLNAFERTACEVLNSHYGYKKVAVLIIRWADHLDQDLNCGAEVKELENLFVDGYRYETEVLILHDIKRPQLQVDSGIKTFILNHDGQNHLLIVYYTGHGHRRDGLKISGRRQPGVSAIAQRFDAVADWGIAEKSLKDETEADVLMVMDTCFAASMMKDSSDDTRSFEVLLASGRDSLANGPGPTSFTAAFIAILRDQLERPPEAPLDTYYLHAKLHARLKADNTAAEPQLLPRLDSRRSPRHIRLEPLRIGSSSPTADMVTQEASSLTLRLTFGALADFTAEQALELARHLSAGAINARLGVKKMEWIKFVSSKDESNESKLSMHETVQLRTSVRTAQRLWKRRVRSRKREATPGAASAHGSKRPRLHDRECSARPEAEEDHRDMPTPAPSNRSQRSSPTLP